MKNAPATGSAGILPANSKAMRGCDTSSAGWKPALPVAPRILITSLCIALLVVASVAPTLAKAITSSEIVTVRRTTASAGSGFASVKIDGRKIIVTRDHDKNASGNYIIKGVCYSNDANGLTFYENLDRDLELLKAIHANSIRTFRPFAAYKEGAETVELDYEKTKRMLDKLAEAGISVTVGFDSARDIVGGIRDDATGRVYREAFYLEYIKAFAAHPAVLAWAFGNEYNYKYAEWFGGDKGRWLAILADAVKNAKAVSSRPTAVVHGELPREAEMLEYRAIPGLDMVMLNIYRGPGFGALYKDWESLTRAAPMPVVLSEFGRSSMDGRGNDTGALQAAWLEKMWAEVESNFTGSGAGGYVFSLKDEAWKGDFDSGPNIGLESHLGIFTADGQPKPAARVLMRLWKAAEHEKKLRGKN
ncbi:hypothetical protein M2103_001267 [Ereboglobus sp. PH5-5]|nr:hypothetical protein [Ereboglobus sp. PH5-5]